MPETCAYCGKEFTPTRPWQRYCCEACRRGGQERTRRERCAAAKARVGACSSAAAAGGAGATIAGPPLALPRGPDPMMGLHPGSLLMSGLLQDPVLDDQRVEDMVGLVAYIESRKARLEAWHKVGRERLAQAEAALTASPAYRSLADYCRAHPDKPGGKTLTTAAGTVKLRVQHGVLRVHDAALAAAAAPDALYDYQPPVTRKLSREKLAAIIKEKGPIMVDASGGPVIVAEVLDEVETLSVEPSAEVLGANAEGPRLLTDVKENTHENRDQPPIPGNDGSDKGE